MAAAPSLSRPVDSPVIAAALQPTPERPFADVITEATEAELDAIEAGWLTRPTEGVRSLALSMLGRERRGRGIVERHECIPVDDRPGFFTVRDTATGSGKPYVASSAGCSCPDHQYRGQQCKHMRAVITEEYRLATYAAAWDRACSTWATRCPECGAALETAIYWIGGRGYQSFLVCSAHVEHQAQRV